MKVHVKHGYVIEWKHHGIHVSIENELLNRMIPDPGTYPLWIGLVVRLHAPNGKEVWWAPTRQEIQRLFDHQEISDLVRAAVDYRITEVNDIDLVKKGHMVRIVPYEPISR